MSIVLGKILGGTVLAFVQGLIFLALAPLVGLHLTPLGFVQAATMMFIISFALTGLGFCIAWRMSSTQGFHAIMNLFLMPLWFLSGALFTPQTAWNGLKWVMRINPLSYGLAGLQRAVFGRVDSVAALPAWTVIVGVSVAFAAVMFVCASSIASGHVSADLQ